MDIRIPEGIKSALEGKELLSESSVGKTDSKVYIYDDVVLKVQKETSETINECKIMKALEKHLPIPKLISYCVEDGISYTLMSKINGSMLSDVKKPELLIDLLTEAFRMLWSVDIKEFNVQEVSNILERLKSARYNVVNNFVDVNNVMPQTFSEDGFSSPEALLEWLEKNIPKQDLVFTHGDFCLENIFVNNEHISGFVDLGKAGVADRWQDLAICIRELNEVLEGTNLSSNLLLERLGVEKDNEKLKYYMLLDELF